MANGALRSGRSCSIENYREAVVEKAIGVRAAPDKVSMLDRDIRIRLGQYAAVFQAGVRLRGGCGDQVVGEWARGE